MNDFLRLLETIRLLSGRMQNLYLTFLHQILTCFQGDIRFVPFHAVQGKLTLKK